MLRGLILNIVKKTKKKKRKFKIKVIELMDREWNVIMLNGNLDN